MAAVLVAGILCAIYLAWTPVAPDLAAQSARANVVRHAGDVSWWTGWYGGLSLPTYSIITPPVMAAVGVTVAGALATVIGCWGAGRLFRGTLRPRAGAIVFSMFAVADLLVGRVTFAVGVAFAIWALVAVRAGSRIAGFALALLAYFSSPLAGLFLGIVLLAVVSVDRARRRHAAGLAVALFVVGAAMALLFPGTGLMHYSPTAAIAPGVGSVLIALTCRPRIVRAVGLAAAIALPVFMIVPGAVGSNIARLAWVGAVPVLVGCATLDRRRLAVAAVVLTTWPAVDVVEQVHWMPGASTRAAFYQPLIRELEDAQTAAGAAALGERLELLDTVNHSGALYLSGGVALARGWDRQADEADNPIFYRPGALTATSYRLWLRQLAVGWVAIPASVLDYAARDEAALINQGLPYLRLVWSSPHWHLYRVLGAAPLASGATITAVGPSSITLSTAAAAHVTLRMRWSPYLRVVDATSGTAAAPCIARTGDWTRVEVPAAGQYTIMSNFDPFARFRSHHQCAE